MSPTETLRLVLIDPTLRSSERLLVAFMVVNGGRTQHTQHAIGRLIGIAPATAERGFIRLQQMGVVTKTKVDGRTSGYALNDPSLWRLHRQANRPA